MKRFYILTACLLIGLLPGSCTPAGVDRFEYKTAEQASIPGQEGSVDRAEIKLYFRNNNYSLQDSSATPVIPVVRSVPQAEPGTRVVLGALISGPTPEEQDRFDVGPVINGTDLQVEDIYIKNNICVVRLLSSASLPLYHYENQTDLQAEAVFMQSLLHSLAGLPPVDAVWVFCNGRPWEGDTLDWLCPLAPRGKGISCTLYYGLDKTDCMAGRGADLLTPVQVRLIASGKRDISECLFKKIIDLLSRDYDPSHRASLPPDLHVLDFTLVDHLLNIDLADPFSGDPGQASVLVGALVYTFTGLPEIDAVTVTLEGRSWEGDGITWEEPLGRDDFDRLMDSIHH